jgi:ribose transport system ATP-binding protein
MGQPCLETINISKNFGPTIALNDVNIKLFRNEIVGIVGENGAGKSTLLNILSGILVPDSGELFLDSEPIQLRSYHDALLHGISRVFQETALVPDIRVYENFFLSFERIFSKFGILNNKEMVIQCARYLRELELIIDPEKVTDHYDYSTRQMIEIAKAFGLLKFLGCENPIILLDEPTAALSESQVQVVFDKINILAKMGTVLFISHRLSEILEICDRIYVFKDGHLISEEQASEINEKKLHSLMVGRNRSEQYYKENEQNMEFGEIVLETINLSSGNQFKDISFQLKKMEIIGIGGVAGSGKEELGKTLAGWSSPEMGTVKVSGTQVSFFSVANMISLGVGYVPKERNRDGIIAGLSVSWNIGLSCIRDILRSKYFFINKLKERELAKRFIKDLKIKTPSLMIPCKALSGGNQQKVSISKWLARPLSVLILDNPTIGIDVGTKEQLYSKFREIVKKGLSILLISDDLMELIGLANRLLIMKDGKIIKEMEGSPENKPIEKEVIGYMV